MNCQQKLPKSRQPALQTSNVIYQIPCKDCSAIYCGQTSRPLHKRISEHERFTRPAYSHATDLQQSSALAQHAHASGHQIDFSSAVILAKLQHQQQLDLVEHAAITVLEPSLNRNHAAPSINPQWHPILQSTSEQFHPISITWSISPFTLVTPCSFSCLSLHLTCIYHCTMYIRIISSHINTSFPISYFIFSVFKRVFYIHFIGWRWLQYCNWRLPNWSFTSCLSQLLFSLFWKLPWPIKAVFYKRRFFDSFTLSYKSSRKPVLELYMAYYISKL